MFKKLATLTLIMLMGTVLFVPNVMAQGGIKLSPEGGVGDPTTKVDCSETPDSPICEDLTKTDNPLFGPTGILTRVAQIFAVITGIISVFMVTLGGLRYVLSGGDSGKTASAKNTILYAVIGVAVASSAGIIAQFILSRL